MSEILDIKIVIYLDCVYTHRLAGEGVEEEEEVLFSNRYRLSYMRSI